jgi:uncharacterized membrane protein
MDFLFQSLFKYSPLIYRKGHLVFDTSLPAFIFIVLCFLLFGVALFSYIKLPMNPSTGRIVRVYRGILIFLRTAALLLILATLARPVLKIATLLPRENIVVLLFDDSRSMIFPDEKGMPRLTAVKTYFTHSHFLDDVGNRFRFRLLKFAREVDGVESIDALDGNGDISWLENALSRVLAEYDHEPLAAVVLFSDGADNASQAFSPVIQKYQAKQIPLYVCGVGQTSMGRDIELLQVIPVRKALPESIISTDVTLRSNGYDGRTVHLELREDKRLIQTKEVKLVGHQELQSVYVQFVVNGKGSKQYTVSIDPLPDEENRLNNSQQFLLDIDDSKPAILYMEGTPRWEFKFIRQAVGHDRSLQLMSLLRTSDNKFYRQGITSEGTLAAGFPTTRKELYEYKGLILGSVESSFFSREQLTLIADFAGERGGGFMMLGGKYSFDEGKFANSPIADILPVVLGGSEPGKSFEAEPLKLQLTNYGKSHPLTQLSSEEVQSEKKWKTLPEIEEFNWIKDAKPGAMILATGSSRRGKAILLAVQRYGRGRTIAFTPSDSWLWQMEMPHGDNSYEIFWRQALRWLVSSSPDPINLELEKTAFFTQETVPLNAQVYDSEYRCVNEAAVLATITPPQGSPVAIPLRSIPDQNGRYSGEFVPRDTGIFKVEIAASLNGRNLGPAEGHFYVSPDSLELYNSAQNKTLLERLARDTGGHYYNLGNANHIPEEMTYIVRPNSLAQILPLWDIPALFLTICLLLISEWSIRKKVRLS